MTIHETVETALTQSRQHFWVGSEGYSGSQQAFEVGDIAELFDVAVERGDYAETKVRAAGVTRDGRYFFLAAGCDTTGWDCQSSCNVAFASDRSSLWTWAMGEDDRRALPKTLSTLIELQESTS
jgi:hypothetical protein